MKLENTFKSAAQFSARRSLRLSLGALLSVFVFAPTGARGADFSPQEKVAMGQGLFEQNGSNSCMYCHGIDGKGGKVAAAAHLNTPKAWKSYKALGGDAAFGKDKAKFVAEFKKAVSHLIMTGAVTHNSTYKEGGYDLSKAGGAINAQMLGLGGAPSQQWLKKYSARGVDKTVAAEAVLEYITSLDSQGVFK